MKRSIYPKEKFPIWRTLAKQGKIFVTVSALLLFTTACKKNPIPERIIDDNFPKEALIPGDYEWYKTWEDETKFYDYDHIILRPTMGVQTYISEIEAGYFIVDHEALMPNHKQSNFTVTYLNGRKKIYTLKEYLPLITKLDTIAMLNTVPMYKHISSAPNYKPEFIEGYNKYMHTLEYVLFGSAFGYYIGKPLDIPQNPNVYRYPHLYTTTSGLKKRHPDNNKLYMELRNTAIQLDKNKPVEMVVDYTDNDSINYRVVPKGSTLFSQMYPDEDISGLSHGYHSSSTHTNILIMRNNAYNYGNPSFFSSGVNRNSYVSTRTSHSVSGGRSGFFSGGGKSASG